MFKVFIITVQLFLVLSSIASFGKDDSKNREVISLKGEWSFFADSVKTNRSVNWAEKGLPKNLIRKVRVPHAWNADKGMEKYWGRSWYERKFKVTKSQLTKITRLQFDAVYHDAIIYVNGKKAGEHLNSGYNRFFINITSYVKDGANTLTVCADNSPSRSNLPFMKSYDWAHDGGIYRGVYEVITEEEAIRNIHVRANPEGNKGFTNIEVFFLDSMQINKSKIRLEAIITEENQITNNEIFKGELKGKYSNGKFVSLMNFDKINPWHFDSPNLYKLSVKLYFDGIEKDEYTTVYGYRNIKVEKNRYILNGEAVRLMGVEWMPGSNLERGMAETREDFEKNLRLMKNANCIFTRFHWQQDEYILDWCDRHGILVQEEIPAWGGSTLLTDTLLKTGLQHLDEMTDAHFNHPSIIIWGIGNELQGHNPTVKSSLKKYFEHAKHLDKSRLVNYVSNTVLFEFPSQGHLPDATYDFDMMMVNEYCSTWYRKSVDSVSGVLDRINKEYPDKSMTISEWGICEPVFKGGDTRRVKEMVQQIAIYGSKPYVAGAIYFCLNDYRTHCGEDFTYSYPQRVHGVCNINLEKKPSYDTLKSISSPIEIKEVTKKDGKILISIRGKNGLPSYTVRNYKIVSGKESITINELKPGEEKTFEIKSAAKDIRILRPTGFEVIKIRASLKT